MSLSWLIDVMNDKNIDLQIDSARILTAFSLRTEALLLGERGTKAIMREDYIQDTMHFFYV